MSLFSNWNAIKFYYILSWLVSTRQIQRIRECVILGKINLRIGQLGEPCILHELRYEWMHQL